MRFEGQKALVTGAAGGIGQALVRALRGEGARVAVTDRDCAGIEAEAHIDGDLLDADFCDGLPAKAADVLGGLDIVVQQRRCNHARRYHPMHRS